MAETTEGVTIGGAYKESDDHVPNPADLYGTFNTHGVGAHHDPATISPIFDVDRKSVATQIKNALDPENPEPSDRVLFAAPQAVVSADTEGEKQALMERVDAELADDVVVGGPSRPEAEAALSGEEGTEAAEAQEAKNNDGAPVSGDSLSQAKAEEDRTAAAAKADEKDGEAEKAEAEKKAAAKKAAAPAKK